MRTTYSGKDVDRTFSITIHRAWMNVESLFSADDDESMLAESIRGDELAIDEYDDFIKYKVLPMGLRNLLVEQQDSINQDVAHNKTLENLH